MIQEYLKVRAYCYQKDLGITGSIGERDYYDEIGEILIVHNNKSVIGGARIVGSGKYKRILLPLEKDGFVLKDNLPEYDLEEVGYCEFTRLAILPEYRSNDLLQSTISHLSQRAIENNYHYLFTIAPLVQARCYRKIFKNLGFNYNILSHVNLAISPIYKDLKGVSLAVLDFFDILPSMAATSMELTASHA